MLVLDLISIKEAFQNRENAKWSRREIKGFVKYCQLCSADKYFRFVSILILNFQNARNVPKPCWVFCKESSFRSVAVCFLHSVFGVLPWCRLEACLSPLFAAFFSTHLQSSLLGCSMLEFLPQPGQCSKQLSTLLSCRISLKMKKIPSYKINMN